MRNNTFNIIGQIFRENGYILLGMCAISVLFVALFSYSTSPLYFHDGYDSCVFMTMGLAILEGKVPYADLFDHKGPVLYFINAFGLWIGRGKIGVFFLQIIANAISFTFIYKIARLFLDLKFSIIALMGAFIFYGYCIQSGDLCEEWMLCLISPALFIALRNIISCPNERRLLFDSAFYGFCFTMCFFIRPNDAVIHLGGIMFGAILWMLMGRHYKRAIHNGVVMGVSCIICALPIILFFVIHDALPDFWYGLIGYNSKYSGGFRELLNSVIYPKKFFVFVILLLSTIVVGMRKGKSLLFVLISQILLAWILMGSRFFYHYWICLIPLFSILWVVCFYWKKWSVTLLLLGCVSCTVMFSCKPSIVYSLYQKAEQKITHHYYKLKLAHDFYDESEKIFSHIPEIEQDKIWNYNLSWASVPSRDLPYFSVFFHHGVVQCNKVPLYQQMNLVDEELRKSDDIKTKSPMWIMLTRDKDLCWLRDNWQKQDYEFIKANYECITMTNPAICEIELWKRK